MIRTVQLSEITKNIKEMCIEANHFLSPDMAEAMKQARRTGYDSDLPGYRNGSCFSGDRTGGTL